MPESADTDDLTGTAGISALAKRIDRSFWLRDTSTDQLLDHIIFLGRLGAPVGIGLLVDGVLMVGAIAHSRTFASELTAATRDALVAFGFDDENVLKVSEGIDELVTTADARLDADREVAERYVDATLDEIPLEHIPNFLRVVRGNPVIDLQSVQIFVSSEPIHVESVRVERKSISAWWPLKAQGVQVNYGAPRDSSEGQSRAAE